MKYIVGIRITKDGEPVSDFLKIVFFDEYSAMDLLNMKVGGSKTKKTTTTGSSNKSVEGKLLTEIGIGKKLFGLAKAYGEISASAGFSKANEKTIEATISNTVLTDYLDIVEDSSIMVLENYKVYPDEKSMTFIKLFAPYLKFVNSEEIPFNINELSSILDESKGYYELIGENKKNDKDKSILRFNVKAFRNNYGLVDLSKMNLVFHAIKVGESTIDSLNAENEFKTNSKIPTIDDVLEQSTEDGVCYIYDVILAGVVDRSENV